VAKDHRDGGIQEHAQGQAEVHPPATLFFIVYYFALRCSWIRAGAESTKVLGVVNIAYLFALSQFFMAWVIAALYLRGCVTVRQVERHIHRKSAR